MSDILAEIAAYKREDVADRKRAAASPRSTRAAKAASSPRGFKAALQAGHARPAGWP
jgi:indole-3-glycerol phosphate synthase